MSNTEQRDDLALIYSFQRGCAAVEASPEPAIEARVSTAELLLKEARLRQEQAEQARRMALRFPRDAIAGTLEECASELERIAAQLESWANSNLLHQ